MSPCSEDRVPESRQVVRGIAENEFTPTFWT